MAKMSYSQMSCFDRCPQLWHYKYVERLKEPPNLAFQYGRCVHKAIAKMLNPKDPRPIEDIVNDRQTFIDEKTNRQYQFISSLVATKGQLWQILFNVKQKLQVFLLQDIRGVEYRLTKIRDFTGIIDLWGRHDRRPFILDWKTTSGDIGEETLLQSDQLVLYAWALMQEQSIQNPDVFFGVIDKTTLLVKLIGTKCTYQMIDNAVEKLSSIDRQIEEGIIYKEKSSCDMWGGCFYLKRCFPDEPVFWLYGDKVGELT